MMMMMSEYRRKQLCILSKAESKKKIKKNLL